MSDSSSPRVSVLILTWNSREVAEGAVESALAQTLPGVEVLVIDNASEDGTAALLQERFGSRARVVTNASNLGYVGGYNSALPLARGEFVLLLNPDARLEADFLERALPAFEDPRVGLVSGLLLRPNGVTVDSSGQFLAHSRRPIDRGFDRAFDPTRDTQGPVLGVCGAAALYRLDMVRDVSEPAEHGEDAHFFDPDYFAFFEDLEVAWRAWRAGWLAVHVPEARAVHMRGGGEERPLFGMMFKHSTPVLAHIVKNRYLTMLRHDRIGALLVDLPFVLAREVAQWVAILLTRPAVIGRLWAERATFTRALRKRRRDRRRRGRWGTWRDGVPERGAWRNSGSVAGAERAAS